MSILNFSRNPKIALALSLIMPGLGQIYNGDLSKGLYLFLCFAFVIPLCAWIGIHVTSILWLIVFLGVVVTLGIYIVCAVDSYKKAKIIGSNYQLKAYNRSYFYIAAVVFCYFFILLSVNNYVTEYFLQLFKIPSASMEPNVMAGDMIFADKSVNRPGSKRKIKRGDIGIFVNPNDRTTIYIKRIVGLPGDRIEIKGTEVFINGEAEKKESYSVIWNKNDEAGIVTIVVPNGYVYVLGDNREKSVDSRKFGPVPLVDVVGIAKQVFFSVSAEKGFVWSRIGKDL